MNEFIGPPEHVTDQCGSRDEQTAPATAPLTPDVGRTVWGRDGRCAEYVARSDHGHFVRPIATFTDWEGDEHVAPTDAIEVWTSIYPAAPKHKVDVELQALKDQIATAKRELSDLGGQKTEAQRDYLAVVKELQGHEILKNLLAVMRGDFTHVVNYGRISTFEEACTYKEDYGRKQAFRLISFAPDGGGKLAWHVNDWSDGSGTDRPVVLCRSIDEAKDAAKAYHLARLGQYEFEKYPHLWVEAAKSAASEGYELTEEVLALAAQAERNAAEEKLSKAREAYFAAQRALDDLQQGGVA